MEVICMNSCEVEELGLMCDPRQSHLIDVEPELCILLLQQQSMAVI